jgi:hypothetical protein
MIYSIGWFITQIINYIPVEIFIVSMEVVIVTSIYRVTVGEWWWDKFFKKQEKWWFKFGSNGWAAGGAGNNPLKTVQHVWKQFNKTRQKSVGEEMRQMVRQGVRQNILNATRKQLDDSLNGNDAPISNAINDQVKKMILEELGNMNKDKSQDDKPRRKGKKR